MVRFEQYTRRIDDVEGRIEAYDLGLPKDLNQYRSVQRALVEGEFESGPAEIVFRARAKGGTPIAARELQEARVGMAKLALKVPAAVRPFVLEDDPVRRVEQAHECVCHVGIVRVLLGRDRRIKPVLGRLVVVNGHSGLDRDRTLSADLVVRAGHHDAADGSFAEGLDALLVSRSRGPDAAVVPEEDVTDGHWPAV